MIKEKLRSLRKEKKMTQSDISKRLGIPRTTYAGYENGSRNPDPETLRLLADFHEVTVDFLLGRDKYAHHIDYNQNANQELQSAEKQVVVERKLKFIRDAYEEMNEEERKDFLRFLDINIEGYQRKLAEERKDRT